VTPPGDAADALGIDFSAAERADYRTLVAEQREALAAVSDAPAPRFETLHGSPERYDGRVVDRRADPERGAGTERASGAGGVDDPADPYNAWLCRCRIPGAASGPLADLTVGIKDNAAVAGLPCTQGSRALTEFVPTVDATVVGRLLDAGATVAGKHNMDAFALGDAGELGGFGPTLNPHDRTRLAGGSSAGSAAAVAAGDCDAAIGTDQAGSVRTPAAWCGVVGVKPTYGLVPYTGLFGMDFGFDHAGVLAGSVADAAQVLETVAGEDRQRVVGFADRNDGDRPADATPGTPASDAAADGVRLDP